MNIRLAAIALAALLLCCAQPGAAATKDSVVKFYQSYLALVSSGDFVTLSRDQPEAYDAKFDAIAKDAGFEDSAAALAAAETYGGDNDVASLKQAVNEKILLQYKPYRE
ncbi:MAG: hypothetical protein ACLGQH_02040 [Acidobacteriota bacterium]